MIKLIFNRDHIGLSQIAFRPKFLPSRVEKERRAVLSELQMMNTIEYRVDCQVMASVNTNYLIDTYTIFQLYMMSKDLLRISYSTDLVAIYFSFELTGFYLHLFRENSMDYV